MYKSDILQKIVDSIEYSKDKDVFWNHKDYILTLQMFKFMVDKLDIDTFLQTSPLTEQEYDKYFSKFVKELDIEFHNQVKEKFEKENRK